MALDSSARTGSAVLVHGRWGNPADWRWVAGLLTDAGVEVVAPDLPSHRSASAGVPEDVAEVRRAVLALTPPVVLVGWSYGGVIITRAAAEEPSISHLIYLASIPESEIPQSAAADTLAFFEQDPHMDVRPDGTCVPDGDWWLEQESGATLPEDVREALRRHPRRPAALKSFEAPPTSPVWETIPTTVLLGRDDPLAPVDERALALRADVRILDSDHFILFRRPQIDIAAAAILDALPVGDSRSSV